MKLKEIREGMKVYDRNYPWLRGEVREVLKTRVKVHFPLEDDLVTYDEAHCQFLEETEGSKWKTGTSKVTPITRTKRA